MHSEAKLYDQSITDYKALQKDLGSDELPNLCKEYFTLTPEHQRNLSTLADVWSTLEDFNPKQGWLQTPSQVHQFENEEIFKQLLIKQNKPETYLLTAECCKQDKTQSLHLQWTGNNWHCVIWHVAKEPITEHFQPCLTEEATFLQRNQNKILRYQRLWQYTPQQGYQLFAARFMGFGECK